ncbi:MAG: hypothetical protein EOP76_18855 [Variovorax sp.]|nr:MAG: hypothetical protein EOP76_18855 [Variovorax sp.]
MRFVVAAEDHGDGADRVALEDRHRDATGQAGGLCRSGAAKVGAFEFLQHDRVPGVPGTSWQALAAAEAEIVADGGETGGFAEQPAAEFQQAAVLGRHPVFDNPDERFHGRGPPLSRPLPAGRPRP